MPYRDTNYHNKYRLRTLLMLNLLGALISIILVNLTGTRSIAKKILSQLKIRRLPDLQLYPEDWL